MLLSLTLVNSLLGVTGGGIDAMVAALQLPALDKLPVEVREVGAAYRAADGLNWSAAAPRRFTLGAGGLRSPASR